MDSQSEDEDFTSIVSEDYLLALSKDDMQHPHPPKLGMDKKPEKHREDTDWTLSIPVIDTTIFNDVDQTPPAPNCYDGYDSSTNELSDEVAINCQTEDSSIIGANEEVTTSLSPKESSCTGANSIATDHQQADFHDPNVGDTICVAEEGNQLSIKRKAGNIRTLNSEKRLKGEDYLGYERVDKKKTRMQHGVAKQARVMGERCSGKRCQGGGSTRKCSEVDDASRADLFKAFWKDMNGWKEREMYIASLVERRPPKQRKGRPESKKSRDVAYFYFLMVKNERKPVCQTMFLNTYGLKNSTVRHWLSKYSLIGSQKTQGGESDSPSSDVEEQSGNKETPCSSTHRPNSPSPLSRKTIEQRYNSLYQFLDNIPKLPSHYCRSSTSKLYLQTDITSMKHFYRIYSSHCAEKSTLPLAYTTFIRVCKKKKISIFIPKKDQCDTCFKHKNRRISDEEYAQHVKLKEAPRTSKSHDKVLAQEGKVYTLCVDVMAVKLLPHIQASVAYYKMKLAIHNYTIYNLANHDALNVWFTETEGSLVASSFATCLIDEIERLLGDEKRDVIVYSDGCTNQNRNAVLANALLGLSIEKEVFIYQKFLEKGHSQMEGDSAHSVIERAMENKEFYLPHELITLTKQARSNPMPYRARLMYHNEFRDYSNPLTHVYRSIRPGNKPHEPTVMDLRVLQYDPAGIIRYKLSYEEDFKELPRRPCRPVRQQYPHLHPSPLPIPKDKWDDLQFMKSMMPRECENFYDTLPHAENSVRKAKRAEKSK